MKRNFNPIYWFAGLLAFLTLACNFPFYAAVSNGGIPITGQLPSLHQAAGPTVIVPQATKTTDPSRATPLPGDAGSLMNHTLSTHSGSTWNTNLNAVSGDDLWVRNPEFREIMTRNGYKYSLFYSFHQTDPCGEYICVVELSDLAFDSPRHAQTVADFIGADYANNLRSPERHTTAIPQGELHCVTSEVHDQGDNFLLTNCTFAFDRHVYTTNLIGSQTSTKARQSQVADSIALLPAFVNIILEHPYKVHGQNG